MLLLPGLRAGPSKTPGSANVCDSWDARLLLEVKGHPGVDAPLESLQRRTRHLEDVGLRTDCSLFA